MSKESEERIKIALQQFERSDRHYRMSRILLYSLITFVVAFLIFQNNQQQAANKKQLDTLAGYAKQRSVQINDLQKHIDCITTFFAQPNRTELNITNLETCNLSRTPDLTPPKPQSSAKPAPKTSVSQPQSTATKPATPAATTPDPSPKPAPGPIQKAVAPITNFIKKIIGVQ